MFTEDFYFKTWNPNINDLDCLFLFVCFHVLEDFRVEESVGVDAPQVVEVVPVVERHEVVGHQVGKDGGQTQNILENNWLDDYVVTSMVNKSNKVTFNYKCSFQQNLPFSLVNNCFFVEKK